MNSEITYKHGDIMFFDKSSANVIQALRYNMDNQCNHNTKIFDDLQDCQNKIDNLTEYLNDNKDDYQAKKLLKNIKNQVEILYCYVNNPDIYNMITVGEMYINNE